MTFRPPVLAVWCALALVAGCKPARSPIFDWAPVDPAAGNTGSIQAGQSPAAGSGGTGGTEPVDGGAGRAGSGIGGESGRSGPLDQNVRFDWVETLPSDNCASRLFVGRFTCPVENSPLPAALDGTVVLRLVGPDEMQLLTSDIGILNVPLAMGGDIAINTNVIGRAECMSRLFAGNIPEMTLTPDQTGILFSLGTWLLCAGGNTVKGTMVGRLEPDGLSLTGDIAMTIGACTCKGSFDLRAQR